VPDAQLNGPRSVALALLPHAGSWVEANVAAAAERFQHPFLTANGAGEAEDAAAGEEAGLAIDGEGVAMTALRRRDGWLELRLLGQGPEATTAVVTGDFREAREADLRGRAGASVDVLDGRLSLPIGAWELRTLQLR
jgi:alpha-mannosidase